CRGECAMLHRATPTKNCRADGHRSASVIHFTPLIVMSSLQLSLGARQGIQNPGMRCPAKGQISAQKGKAPQAYQSTPKIRSAVYERIVVLSLWLASGGELRATFFLF